MASIRRNRKENPILQEVKKMEKFNLYEELKKSGFAVDPYNDGDEGYLVRDDFSREIEVLWFGKQITTMTVAVQFNQDRTVCTAYYYEDGFKRPFKVKTHMADKRAFNAIKTTVENKSFEF